MNFEVQNSSLWEQTLFLSFCEQQALLQLILGGGFFLGDRYFSHMHILIVTQLNTQGDPLQISRVLFLCISLLFVSVLWTLPSLVPWSPETQYYLLNSWSSLCSTSQGSLFFVLWYPMSSKLLFYIFYPFLIVRDGRVNPVPILLSLLEAEMSLVFRHLPLQ